VSEHDLALARRTFEAFAERDLTAMVEIMHSDVEFMPVSANITTGGVPYRGHEGIERYLLDVDSLWPQLRLVPGEMRDLGDGVLVLGRVVARGGGMILDRPTGWLFRIREGKIARLRVYGSHDEALDAAGRPGD
jgi:ketosteroid isomerase-like protein